jgi:hypothetical protein
MVNWQLLRSRFSLSKGKMSGFASTTTCFSGWLRLLLVRQAMTPMAPPSSITGSWGQENVLVPLARMSRIRQNRNGS